MGTHTISTIGQLAEYANYSLLDSLVCDPDASQSGIDHDPRQVFSGHYVPVKPTPIAAPQYVAHSSALFNELCLDDALAQSPDFIRLFSGDVASLPPPMRKIGWATGYALSIYGTEYTQQCPFQTGNGYGDGRAVSVLEVVIANKRWEMQLKGGGRTPYCRGADGRAVLRSSVREFLAQEFMHALGVPTSRSLCLVVSNTERVDRPWYTPGSWSPDPDVMVSNPVAITTRVAHSFLRVGQLELFGRRARNGAHPNAMQELEAIVQHVIAREYDQEINHNATLSDKVLSLANAFRARLTTLVTHWLRVGYCQGNFNSDNCAVGGFTLDYGPFGFCETFDPVFQPWTGGGRHFSFFNQPVAAEQNFAMFCRAVEPLLSSEPEALARLEEVRAGFSQVMERKIEAMWAAKLGLEVYDSALLVELLQLMVKTSVDYTMLFRELSYLPEDVSALYSSFYSELTPELTHAWQAWFEQWRAAVTEDEPQSVVSEKMLSVNPKYTWREWRIVPAYEQAERGDYALIHELQALFSKPYEEQSERDNSQYYQLRPREFMRAGGVAHYSCSS